MSAKILAITATTLKKSALLFNVVPVQENYSQTTALDSAFFSRISL